MGARRRLKPKCHLSAALDAEFPSKRARHQRVDLFARILIQCHRCAREANEQQASHQTRDFEADDGGSAEFLDMVRERVTKVRVRVCLGSEW